MAVPKWPREWRSRGYEAQATAPPGIPQVTLTPSALAGPAPEIAEVAPSLFVCVGVHDEVATAANKNAIRNIGFIPARSTQYR